MMFTRAAVVAALALVAGPCFAGGQAGLQASDARSGVRAGERSDARADDVLTIDDREVKPWIGPRKTPSFMLEMTDTSTGRLRIKFTNQVRARVLADRATFRSENGVDLDGVKRIFEKFQVVASPAFRRTALDIQALEARALARGVEAPDLRGMYILDGPRGNLLAAARALNDLDVVEWVVVEEQRKVYGSTGACCYPDASCINRTPIQCLETGGTYQGDGTSCVANPNQCFGACCLKGGDATDINVCNEQSSDACASAGGIFQGFNTTCAGVAECEAACCLPDSTCQTLTEADCMATGVDPMTNWFEDIIACSFATCRGACCLPTAPGVNPCQLRLEDDCANAGGVFVGIGTACLATACDGACCLLNGICNERSQANCAQAGGTFGGFLTTCMMGVNCGQCCVAGQPCLVVPDAMFCTTLGGTFTGPPANCNGGGNDPCPAPCCYTDAITGFPACMEVDEATCATLNGTPVYLPNNASCANTNCFIGSCCVAGQNCFIANSADCGTAGGVFNGAGSTCTPSPCAGACCLTGGVCQDRTPANCAQAGGVFIGEGTLCATSDCNGACCIADAMPPCSEVLEGQCDSFGGLFLGVSVPCTTTDCMIGVCCFPQLPAPGQPQPPPGCVDSATPDSCAAIEGGVFYILEECADFECPITGACCIGMQCGDLTEQECLAASPNAFFVGEGTSCAGVDCETEPDCGIVTTGSCYNVAGNGSAFCNNAQCCEFVCEIDPWCCAEDTNQVGVWDLFCAAQANLLCIPHDPPDEADRCNTGINGSCFETHQTGGCNNADCCNLVCALLEFCCDGTWSAICVQTAIENCTNFDPAAPNPMPTPDFTDLQGYTTAAPYFPGIPAGLQAWTPQIETDPGPPAVVEPFPGYDGTGWNLGYPGDTFTDANGNGIFDPGETLVMDGGTPGEYDPPGGGEPFVDVNGSGWWEVGEAWTDVDGDGTWDAPTGLYGFGQQIAYEQGVDEIGQGNLTRGKTMKIGIIEFGYYVGHEDLTHVILEPGTTLFQDPVIDEPDHGTACLSIAAALDNGIGVRGIAPDAQPYFFPIVSVEDGPREMDAWFSALATFDGGDVISASYGPGPPVGNLNNDQSMWTIIRLAADLGITVCVAAGNDCFNLDNSPDLGDSGGMVIGACSPGTPFYRLSFSNFCTAASNARSNIVHVRAWGELVASAGYGTLQAPNPLDGSGIDNTRTYHATFNGTSAASPQVAGLVACLQGLAKQFYGIPLQPEVIRGALGAPGAPPAQPTRANLDGGFDGLCSLDVDPELGPNQIGVWPNVAGNFGSAASTILNQSPIGFDDAPAVQDVIIVRGTHIFGNKFSVKRAADNNRLVVEAVPTPRGNVGPSTGGTVGPRGPVGQTFPELSQITYLTQGDISDVAVLATSTAQQPQDLTVTVLADDPGTAALMFVEAYDYQLNRWLFLGVQFLAAGSDQNFVQFTNANARSFIRSSDQRIFVRCWSVGFTLNPLNIGGTRFPHRQRYDFINVEVGQSVGE